MILTSVSVYFFNYTTGNPVFQDCDRFLPFFPCRFLPFFPCFSAFSTFRAAGPGPSTRSPANRQTPKPITAKRHGSGRTIPIPCRLCLYLRRCKQRGSKSVRGEQPWRRGRFRRAKRGRKPCPGRSRRGSGREDHPLRSRERFPERPGPPADPSRNSHSPFLLSTKNNWEEPKWSRKTSTWASISTPSCTTS